MVSYFYSKFLTGSNTAFFFLFRGKDIRQKKQTWNLEHTIYGQKLLVNMSPINIVRVAFFCQFIPRKERVFFPLLP